MNEKPSSDLNNDLKQLIFKFVLDNSPTSYSALARTSSFWRARLSEYQGAALDQHQNMIFDEEIQKLIPITHPPSGQNKYMWQQKLLNEFIKNCEALANPAKNFPNVYAQIMLYKAHISILGQEACSDLCIANYENFSKLLIFPDKSVFLAVKNIALAAIQGKEEAVTYLKKLINVVTKSERIHKLFMGFLNKDEKRPTAELSNLFNTSTDIDTTFKNILIFVNSLNHFTSPCIPPLLKN